MQKEIIIAGFGGQGVLFGGQVLAYAAMDNNLDVTWIPSYGPEMRGGTANCTVVIADHEIGSPLVKNPPLAIALNLPSFDKYESTLASGGTLIVNKSMVDHNQRRDDIHVIFVPCNEIAEEIGDRKLVNMVAIGALLTALPEVKVEDVEKALEGHLPARHKHLLPKNFEALKQGYEYAQKEWDKVPA
ncbi:MAG: 2-oxoacid:acceptor oxidoreductase family protein [Anaerolineales bacterium]|jgi:2-oxoglutarate ferredoxin oxidoreductase subunit gamma|uniref:2-oxoacid:acceptor oxidoreductase family protein n=1 Tax=Candidatus Villigracilis vicinus TaxID=3140679 RepID=UPI0031376A58|nr:2-oxoacid:acceptor oxidoreductase family protein [Anaerolineales bacterium]MBK7448359.1 2-oxoacid:acceptor oxidoreductase family protein [Anaerolineales bacterium]MBK9780981.1 2-oxoacid:acceptor oxidoreductase family protein [Anaerolineales bacterium]